MLSSGDKVCGRLRTVESGPPAKSVGKRRVAGHAALCIAGSLALAVAGLFLMVHPAAIAWGQSPEEDDTRREYNIKLAYLCMFARYVAWPEDADRGKDGKWVVGVLGEDPFRGALDRLAAKKRKIGGRTIVVRHFASLDKYRRCDVLFLPKTLPQKKQEEAIRGLRGKAVLLVGEIPGFAATGGCLGFYRDEDNVRFEINLDSLRDHKIKASSKLLGLAKIVKRSS